MKGKTLTDDQLKKHLITLDQKLLSSISQETFEFSDTFEHKMQKIIKKESKIIPAIKHEKYIKIAATILILIITANVLQNPTAQAFIQRSITEIIEVLTDRTQITLGAIGEGEEFRIIDPSYIPKGYELENREYSLGDLKYNDVYYQNHEGDEIRYSQSYIYAMGIVLDTENLEEDETIEYRGQEYRLMLKNKKYKTYWVNENYFYSLSGYIEKDEIIKMTESIIDLDKGD